MALKQENNAYAHDIKMDQSVMLGDSLSSISWMNSSVFAGTCWDKTVRIFEVAQSSNGPTIMQRALTNLNSPGLCCTYSPDQSSLYIGCADGSIKDLNMGSMTLGSDIGKGGAGISSLHFMPNLNCLVSTGYEKSVHFWQRNNPNPVTSIAMENKIFTSDYKNGVLAGGILGEKVFFIDLELLNRGSSKSMVEGTELGKFSQLQTVILDDKAEMIGMSTTDGRANLSQVSKQNGQYQLKSVVTFKSNFSDEDGSAVLYPVNCSSFSPIFENWFMTAGGNGVMTYWDFKARNKICIFSYSSNPVCCAAISPQGNFMAYGLGNDWHIGEEGINKWESKIGVHLITEKERNFQGSKK